MSELIYVMSRLYEIASVEKPNEAALNLLNGFSKRVKLAEVTREIALEAEEFRKRLRIALTDCYVIVTVKSLHVLLTEISKK
ncbi:MAG: PIN domain-containing protein [Nitrososphaeria archaeon]